MIQKYFLGGPVFAHDAWRGKLFPQSARSEDYLRHYASVLNTVEGNSTFYGLPSDSTVVRWRDQVPPSFRFCFKFPRAVSHEGVLNAAESIEQTSAFFRSLEPIRDRIGVLFLQLPPHFDGSRLGELERFLTLLPRDWSFAVEPRHSDFFDAADREQRFDEMLAGQGINRVVFDTLLLHFAPSNSPEVVEAKRKKPRFPERWTVTSECPFVRFVGVDTVAGNAMRIDLIAQKVADWIAEAKSPFVFLHTPNDDEVPDLCRDFHRRLMERTSPKVVSEMPDWPGEREPKQMSLF